MKKIITLSMLSVSTFIFSQDLTAKQAKENFINSENRTFLKISESEFKEIYKQAKCLKKHYEIELKEMPIFQVKKSDKFIELGRFRQSIFGLGDTIFPSETDDGKKTITCNAFDTFKL